MDLQAFVETWLKSGAAERAHKDKFLDQLCDVLGVPKPEAKTNDPSRDRYVFEHDVPTAHEGGQVTTRKIDLYKHECFILEAKQGSNPGDKKLGFARRGTPQWDVGMRDAYGQAIGYAASMDDPPPLIVICDIGYCFDLYASFDRTPHRPYPNALHHRIWLRDLLVPGTPHVETLRRVWTEPLALDPLRHAAKVTRQVAESIAELARSLEEKRHPPEVVAKFLMRCLFTMFAEDVGLLPKRSFTNMIKDYWIPNPPSFAGPGGVSALWRTMNTGGAIPLIGDVWRFNGGLFADTSAIPLTKDDLDKLYQAALRDWGDVEPAIFGTLLERALDKKERHMLGAHFTPRAYVERLVRPTIEEPLREEWENVQAAARKLRLDGKAEEARKDVHAYLRKLSNMRVLDPACGSGNFLYVALDLFKRIESEVLALLRELGEVQEKLALEGERVTPKQFLGIEVKPWAKEIADLVLWIGYLQWYVRSYGKTAAPPDPVLHAYGNIECRDAVLAWDGEPDLVRDESGKPATRWDGETYKKNPLTGEDIPDDTARTVVYDYVSPRKAEWPRADFIIGNPPFGGGWKIRQGHGDGYVEALWKTYPWMPEKADYVMYWWDRAADLVRHGEVKRFGLITTNSISQTFQRRVVERHLDEEKSILRIAFAIPDHPWIDSADAAAVRIAMTVGDGSERAGQRARVGFVTNHADDEDVRLTFVDTDRIGSDLRAGISLARAKKLMANERLCSPGVQLYGAGFIVDAAEAAKLRTFERDHQVVRAYVNGRDLMGRTRGSFVIDFFGLTEAQAARANPAAFQRALDRVKPERDHNRRAPIREKWWRFGWERPALRSAVSGLKRFIVTPETARHRVFTFLPAEVLPDNKLWAFAVEDALLLGLLSSRVHVTWALAAGGRLGVGNDPVYNKSTCFDRFPFPVCSDTAAQHIRDLAEALDAHRQRRQAEHPELTLTGIYNVLEKLRRREALSDKDQVIHEHGLVSVLRKLHDDLDAAVLTAYGWPLDLSDEQILQRLVALNAERADEEAHGVIRWLRPDLQSPAGGRKATQEALLAGEEPEPEPISTPDIKPWPKKLSEKIAVVRDRLASSRRALLVEEVAAAFKRAPRKDVEEILDGLAAVGVLTVLEAEGGKRWRATVRAA
jgi:hypothetical protein